jgi:predicted transcriptional regulator of viral defense system
MLAGLRLGDPHDELGGCRAGHRVRPERYFGVERVWVGEARVTVTDPERTLLDALAMPQYCGDFAEVLHAFEARGAALDLDRIIHYGLFAMKRGAVL